MPIRLKVAKTAKELDDVFRLRHEVFVQERGNFSSDKADSLRIVDHFDTLPDVANIVAYEGSKAIATMRINRDSSIGLPAEKYFDFSDARSRLKREYQASRGQDPQIASGSMLAIHKGWRNKKNVSFALLKTAAGVMYGWGATHAIAAISKETLSLYSRFGFEVIADPVWNESVGDTLVPIMAPTNKVFEWTFGSISTGVSHFWLDNFCSEFERLLLSPGEVLFSQYEPARHAYAVDTGWISISRTDPNNNEMILANLSKGALFGELAIFDGENRDATATALMNTELIVIERNHMLDIIRQNPEKLDQLLGHFARRIRETDNLAMVLAFAPQTSRVEVALSRLWHSAIPDRKKPRIRIAKVGPEQLAKAAQVREAEVRRVLEMKKAKGCLNYGDNVVRFLRPPRTGDTIEILKDSPV
ncbi:cAMP-activated global transcriptional regulator CRP [bacterium BMS3Abin11]|nr:cAMP-activated global transcriptional regulator CRP [bacterium BMS3Abin11]